MNEESNFKLAHLKTVYSYSDVKDNAKYLIYFVLNGSSISLNITDGLSVWTECLDETGLQHLLKRSDCLQWPNAATLAPPLTLNNFIELLNQMFRCEKYELNKILHETEDLIELKSDAKNSLVSFKILLNRSKSSSEKLRAILFNLHDRLSTLETEYNRMTNKSDFLDRNSCTSSILNAQKECETASSSNGNADQMRKFHLNAKKHSAAHLLNRRPGMSLIKPLSKRKKEPQGVKFDSDEEAAEENKSESSNSAPSAKSPCKKPTA